MSIFFDDKDDQIKRMIRKINKLDSKVEAVYNINNCSWVTIDFNVKYKKWFRCVFFLHIHQDKTFFIRYYDEDYDLKEDDEDAIKFTIEGIKRKKYASIFLEKHFTTIKKYIENLF